MKLNRKQGIQLENKQSLIDKNFQAECLVNELTLNFLFPIHMHMMLIVLETNVYLFLVGRHYHTEVNSMQRIQYETENAIADKKLQAKYFVSDWTFLSRIEFHIVKTTVDKTKRLLDHYKQDYMEVNPKKNGIGDKTLHWREILQDELFVSD